MPSGRRKCANVRTISECFCRERENRGLDGGEGGIRTPETLSSLHAFQACALNRARPPLRAHAIMHHTNARGQFVNSKVGLIQSDMPRRKGENDPGLESADRIFWRTRPSVKGGSRRMRLIAPYPPD